ncbi:MAG: endonuclease III [Candidatus Muirbacterium halophilum]|nr:endonuclease III [Candidatus Muirbacterium halophilum]MCK9474582.1 endonuclease III [Candidatus Muirbacterium halophilum]
MMEFTINNIDTIIIKLRELTENFVIPSVTSMALDKVSPFEILISTLLSLRTKDETTYEVSLKLFEIANTPQKILNITDKELQKIIFKTGFYRNKAKTLKHVSQEIINKYDGNVPDSIEELLTINGIGRKTANLVVIKAYNKPGICVDTHVHRISNRIGFVNTKNADKTEFALRKTLPKKYWCEINDILVKHGQNICRPISPKCNLCNITQYCKHFLIEKN